MNILSNHETQKMHLLDFACGTGRVLRFLEGRFGTPTGVDVSKDMLEFARQACTKSNFVCGDVTRGDLNLVDRYEVITAFRFLLNAEPSLQRLVLKWIHGQLCENGLFICNFHLNPLSLTGLWNIFYAYSFNKPLPNMISLKKAKRILSQMNFKVIDIYGYGHMFYRRSGIRSSIATLLKVEKMFMNVSWLKLFARNLLFVAAK